MDKQTCAERIKEQFQGRNVQLEEIYDKLEGGEDIDYEEQEEAREEYHNLPLSVEKKVVYEIHLSTGGPADWVEVIVDEEDYNRICSMTYHFSDWFDHAQMPIHTTDYLWQYASEIIDLQ
jgi:hypothetical protein